MGDPRPFASAKVFVAVWVMCDPWSLHLTHPLLLSADQPRLSLNLSMPKN